MRAGAQLAVRGDVAGWPDLGHPIGLSRHRGPRGEGGQTARAPVERVAVAQAVGEAGAVGGRLGDEGRDRVVAYDLDQARAGVHQASQAMENGFGDLAQLWPGVR